MGRTRAEILSCIARAPGCTTSELASYTGVSLSSASEHANVLRQNKLTDGALPPVSCVAPRWSAAGGVRKHGSLHLWGFRAHAEGMNGGRAPTTSW
ncbi:winged helix-turn-helix domain-containing protein [Nonomuraea jabiensis]|uniref:winged helix-turn-helix domain-containing protein n=1 Tax=Nonomuraea jabiensis TaxID=882448 RepID=UPI001FEC69E2|nr:winged helix-turn-helix domain-containing protein [Nonomuraea jabiensis]